MRPNLFCRLCLMLGAMLVCGAWVQAKPEPGGPGGPPPANFAAALDNLIVRKADRDFRIDVRWSVADQGAAATIFGNGVGLWRDEKQFRLTKEQVQGMLQDLQNARFAAMAPSFGGLKFPKGGPRPGVPVRLIGGVSVTIGNFRHDSQQLGGGEQSKELAELATRLLTVCEKAAEKGVAADTFADGLSKIVKKDLDPLTLSLLLHRIQNEGSGPDGWLFRINGQTVTTSVRSAKGYATPIRYDMTRKELEDIIKLLADNDAGNLPINLFATEYTDFDVKVLNKNKNLQARRFGNMTAKTHGARQEQFDRIFAGLQQLHLHALKNGKAEPEVRE